MTNKGFILHTSQGKNWKRIFLPPEQQYYVDIKHSQYIGGIQRFHKFSSPNPEKT